MMVWLYAKVTYGGDRITNKLVTFEVHNALGEKVTILENYTDINGIATVHFRIPQTDLIPGGEDPAIIRLVESYSHCRRGRKNSNTIH
jgi:hypothetical protein